MSEAKECREAFEAEFKPETHDGKFWMRKNRNGDYSNPSMQSCWQGWQRAWSRAAKPAVPANYVDYQQRRGAHADIVDEAIGAYEQWLLDDDYDPHGALKRIIERMRERRALYAAPPLPVAQGWQPMDSAPKVDGEEILALVQWKWQKEPRRRILNWNDGIGKVGYTWPCWMCSVSTVHIPDEMILGWMPLSAAPTPPAAPKENTP